ncbi:MAG: glycoside hydrolase family 65 protein [Candidatus Hydrogenedentes bacterium]|nr:glycoside hydrolase family 65 protein [Candidatus Hydrogenedentota bacterium]
MNRLRRHLVEDPRWHVCEKPWEPERNQVWESLCTLGNGYLGIRGHPEESWDAGPSLVGTYVAGVYAPDDHGIPELVNLPNIFATNLVLNGSPMRLANGNVTEYVRQLDMRHGVLRRSLVFTHHGHTTWVRFERFVCLDAPHLAGQRVVVVPLNWSGELEFTFTIDGAVSNRSGRHIRVIEARQIASHIVMLLTHTLGSEIRVGQIFRAQPWTPRKRPISERVETDNGRAELRYRCHLEPDECACFDRVLATYTSRDPIDTSVERASVRSLRGPRAPTYATLLAAHTAAWRREWRRCDIEIDGPEQDQRAVRFAVFHLIQSCSRQDASVSIGAKGLSGEAYRGHVFWDTEIFMLPFFIFTNPAAARRLLEYRHRTLAGARRKAREAGYRGAMFAWESADTGDETCPRFVPDPRTGEPVRVLCGDLEQHISADIVYGADHYLRHHADRTFKQGIFAEIAIETARFWASRVTWNPSANRYSIPHVIGPDEFHEDVGDSTFTNYMAAWNLRTGAAAARELLAGRSGHSRMWGQWLRIKESEPDQWEAIADGLTPPVAGNGPLIEQHKGFFALQQVPPEQLSARISRTPEKQRMRRLQAAQVIKQADVLMLFMLWPQAFSRAQKLANWRYYEPRTTHDSSLSAGVHSIVASDLAHTGRAYHYFRFSAFMDLEDRLGNTCDGLHLAAMGVTWQSVVRGFLQMRAAENGLMFHPRLPKSWKEIRLAVRHRRMVYRVVARPDLLKVTEEQMRRAGLNKGKAR